MNLNPNHMISIMMNKFTDSLSFPFPIPIPIEFIPFHSLKSVCVSSLSSSFVYCVPQSVLHHVQCQKEKILMVEVVQCSVYVIESDSRWSWWCDGWLRWWSPSDLPWHWLLIILSILKEHIEYMIPFDLFVALSPCGSTRPFSLCSFREVRYWFEFCNNIYFISILLLSGCHSHRGIYLVCFAFVDSALPAIASALCIWSCDTDHGCSCI